MYWVRGDGSSSYLSKGNFSTSIGDTSEVLNQTMGWTSRGGWKRGGFTIYIQFVLVSIEDEQSQVAIDMKFNDTHYQIDHTLPE